MNCPGCAHNIEEHDIDVLESGLIIGMEVSFTCGGCGEEYCCIVVPASFVKVSALAGAGRDKSPFMEAT